MTLTGKAPEADPASLQQRAIAALDRGDWAVARDLGARLLQAAPGHRSFLIAGVAASRLRDWPRALDHLRQASRLDPHDPETAVELARTLLSAGLIPEATAAAERAAVACAGDAGRMNTLGVIFGQSGMHERALDSFRAAVRLSGGNDARSRFNLGTSLAFAGDIPGAEAEFEASLALDPTNWRAYLLRSHLRRQMPDSNHLAALRGVLASNREPLPQTFVNLAIAKELEDLGAYDESFAHLVAGKTAGGRGRNYSTARDFAFFRAMLTCFPEPVPTPPDFGSDEPIFVIGMPRTGTTLVERILSNHPDVHSAGELRNFVVALSQVCGGTPNFMFDPRFQERVAALDWQALGERYLASTRPLTGHTPRFVDKFPQNFLYAGFIARALPRARIVCLRRGAADTCLSNFRQLFALESPYFDYSFDLLDTGRYYVMFDQLMAHWKRVLPGRIMELSYEALVDNQEQETRRLLEFCGLTWNEACLRFEDNAAPVATASTVQVREPMNRRSIGRWRRYEEQMSGLVALLAAHGVQPDA
jgi:tetratricopeptide (TPR) repeat protein